MCLNTISCSDAEEQTHGASVRAGKGEPEPEWEVERK